MQSERMYAALKGHGAPCRLVILPHESHGYRSVHNAASVLDRERNHVIKLLSRRNSRLRQADEPDITYACRARESILHTLHETDVWLAKYVGCGGEPATVRPLNGSKEPDAEPVSAAKL